MKTTTYIEFEAEERDEIARALVGHENAIEYAPRNPKKEESDRPVRRHLSRLREHKEPYNEEGLRELDETLRRLIILWMPETTAEAWRKLGPTGPDAGRIVENLEPGVRMAYEIASAP